MHSPGNTHDEPEKQTHYHRGAGLRGLIFDLSVGALLLGLLSLIVILVMSR